VVYVYLDRFRLWCLSLRRQRRVRTDPALTTAA
jgi:hypothetical protein